MSQLTSQMQAILDTHAELGPLPIETLTPEQARLVPLLDKAALSYYGQHFMKRVLAPMPLPVNKIDNLLIPGADSDIMARIYTPKSDAPKEGWPVVVYFHGGGWVIANLDTYDGSARAICDAADSIVVSVHYRQAPEHPWPAAPEDAFAAYKWVRDHIHKWNGDAYRIAVAGESAGGNLAAVVCLMARDKKIAMPAHQLLIYPVTDLARGSDSASAIEHADAKPLNRKMLKWFYELYASPENRKHEYASPLYTDLEGLPTATIILAAIDPLRSDGQAYAERLDSADVPVTVRVYEGVTHEFFGLAGLLDEATQAVAFAGSALKDAFHRRSQRRHAA